MKQKHKISATLILLALTQTQISKPGAFDLIDFDSGMKYELWLEGFKRNGPGLQTCVRLLYPEAGSGMGYLEFLKKQYCLFRTKREAPAKQGIPRIIHQIWLGAPMPEYLKQLQHSWIEKHPKWTYILWTDKDVANINLPNSKLYYQAKTYGERSDILRYTILYEMGGIYADTDFECLKSFEPLVDSCDFFSGIHSGEPSFIGLANGLIGACPQHPIIKECLDYLPTAVAKQEQIHKEYSRGVFASGPALISRCFFVKFDTGGYKNVALPSTYFYPVALAESGMPPDAQKKAIRPESFTLHRWFCMGQTQVCNH